MSNERNRSDVNQLLDLEGQSLAQLGYRMPAEWERHDATWLSWPKKEESWPGKIGTIPPVYAQFIRALSEGEAVHLIVDDHEMDAAVRRYLKENGADAPNVYIHEIPSNDAWMRDYGPIFVRNTQREPKLIAIDWGYNSWGGKYPPYDKDDVVPIHAGEILGVPVVEGGMILEGGSIDPNGAGVLLTTEQCLLNPNRNPQLSREQIERRMSDMLGLEKIIWLGDGIEGDDTDGHIDDLSRFVDTHRIVTIVERDEKDANYRALRENLERLESATDQHGSKFEVIQLPTPNPVIYEGQRLPASYANFYIANACVVVPTYDSPAQDEEAIGVLRDCYPDRKVVGIRATDLVWGLGAFHCISQQQPAAK